MKQTPFEFPPEELDKLRAVLEIQKPRLEKAEPILEKREKYCDKKGHKKPNKENNLCNHCYRTLVYHTSVDDLIKPRRKLSPYERRVYDRTVRRIRNVEILSQKACDRIKGLCAIADEYKF